MDCGLGSTLHKGGSIADDIRDYITGVSEGDTRSLDNGSYCKIRRPVLGFQGLVHRAIHVYQWYPFSRFYFGLSFFKAEHQKISTLISNGLLGNLAVLVFVHRSLVPSSTVYSPP